MMVLILSPRSAILQARLTLRTRGTDMHAAATTARFDALASGHNPEETGRSMAV